MTNSCKEIVEFLLHHNFTLFLASQKNWPTKKSFCQEHEKRIATAYGSLCAAAVNALPSRCRNTCQCLTGVRGEQPVRARGKMRWEKMLLLHSLHLSWNDGFETDDQQLLPFCCHLVFHTVSRVKLLDILFSV